MFFIVKYLIINYIYVFIYVITPISTQEFTIEIIANNHISSFHWLLKKPTCKGNICARKHATVSL